MDGLIPPGWFETMPRFGLLVAAAAAARPLPVIERGTAHPAVFLSPHPPVMLAMVGLFVLFVWPAGRKGRFQRWQGWPLLALYALYAAAGFTSAGGKAG